MSIKTASDWGCWVPLWLSDMDFLFFFADHSCSSLNVSSPMLMICFGRYSTRRTLQSPGMMVTAQMEGCLARSSHTFFSMCLRDSSDTHGELCLTDSPIPCRYECWGAICTGKQAQITPWRQNKINTSVWFKSPTWLVPTECIFTTLAPIRNIPYLSLSTLSLEKVYWLAARIWPASSSCIVLIQGLLEGGRCQSKLKGGW